MENINQLPSEILCKVFNYVQNLGAPSTVCHQWKEYSDVCKVYDHTRFLASPYSKEMEDYMLATRRRYKAISFVYEDPENPANDVIAKFLESNKLTVEKILVMQRNWFTDDLVEVLEGLENFKCLQITYTNTEHLKKHKTLKLPKLKTLELYTYEADIMPLNLIECSQLEVFKSFSYWNDLLSNKKILENHLGFLEKCKNLDQIIIGKHCQTRFWLKKESLFLSIYDLKDLDFVTIWNILESKQLESINEIKLKTRQIPNWFAQKLFSRVSNLKVLKLQCGSYVGTFENCFVPHLKELHLYELNFLASNITQVYNSFPNIQVLRRNSFSWEPDMDDHICGEYEHITNERCIRNF